MFKVYKYKSGNYIEKVGSRGRLRLPPPHHRTQNTANVVNNEHLYNEQLVIANKLGLYNMVNFFKNILNKSALTNKSPGPTQSPHCTKCISVIIPFSQINTIKQIIVETRDHLTVSFYHHRPEYIVMVVFIVCISCHSSLIAVSMWYLISGRHSVRRENCKQIMF